MSWMAFVRDDLRAKIGRGATLPPRLTLNELSLHYGVSTTPVRSAIDELVDEEFLVRHDNGRLTVNHEKVGSLAESLSEPPEPPRDHREVIARDLFLKSLSGGAEFVREEPTAEQYSVSTAAVREVFHQLAGQGLLRHFPRRGWQLRAFRRKDLEDYLRIREVLELTALEQAWPHLVDEELKAIYDGNQLPSDENAWPVIDNSLHDYIVDKADNFYARDFFERHGKYFKTVWDWDAQDRESAIESVAQHREVLSAMLCRDLPSAKRALAHHIRTNYAILKQMERMDRRSSEDE